MAALLPLALLVLALPRSLALALATVAVDCKQGHFIMVFSARHNYDRRSAIRKSWADDYTYFFMGARSCPYPVPRDEGFGFGLWRGRDEKVYECRDRGRASPYVEYRHAVGAAETAKAIALETRFVGDVVLLNFTDDYRSLPRKLKLSYAWALRNTNARWIMKADDDIYVHPPRLHAFLRKLPRRNAVVGRIIRAHAVPRDGKWAESRRAYPNETYPPFPNGAEGHVVSRQVADAVVRHHGPELQGQDVSLGFWVHRYRLGLGVEWVDSALFHRQEVGGGTCRDRVLTLAHDISPQMMAACPIVASRSLDFLKIVLH